MLASMNVTKILACALKSNNNYYVVRIANEKLIHCYKGKFYALVFKLLNVQCNFKGLEKNS